MLSEDEEIREKENQSYEGLIEIRNIWKEYEKIKRARLKKDRLTCREYELRIKEILESLAI